MTKICRKVVRTRYYSKSKYEYVTLWLYLPKKYHETLEPYVGQDLEVAVHRKNGKIQITLTPKQSRH